MRGYPVNQNIQVRVDVVEVENRSIQDKLVNYQDLTLNCPIVKLRWMMIKREELDYFYLEI